MWILSVIGLGVLLNTKAMLSVMLLFASSVFVFSMWIFPRAPELGIMFIFCRYSGRFLLTY